MDWAYVFYGVLIIGALAVMGEVVLVGCVIGFGYQVVQWVQTGEWPSYTLGSQLGVPADFQPTHWVIIDRLIHYALFDVELVFVVLICAGLTLPIREWLERDTASPKKSVKSSGAPGITAAAPVYFPPTGVSSTVPDVSLRPEHRTLGRLGIFLGWLFNAAALICAAPAVLIWIKARDSDAIFGWVLLAAAGAVWLFGRGVRYVFVGPKETLGPAKAFAERFADPNVPVRLAPNPPQAVRTAQVAAARDTSVPLVASRDTLDLPRETVHAPVAATASNSTPPSARTVAANAPSQSESSEGFSLRTHWGYIVWVVVMLLFQLGPKISSWFH